MARRFSDQTFPLIISRGWSWKGQQGKSKLHRCLGITGVPTVHTEMVPAVFGAGLEDELEGTVSFAQWVVIREGMSGPNVMPKWSKKKVLSALTMPCKATCFRKVRGEREEQSVSCNEANDDPYRIMDQTTRATASCQTVFTEEF